MGMVGGLSLSEPTTSLLNCTAENSLFPCWVSVPKRPVCVFAPRRKRQSRITAMCSGNSGGIIIDQEFEFKTSFDEYLKAMESIKVERDNIENKSNNNPRRNKAFKRIVEEEEGGSDELTIAEENSRKENGFLRKSVFAQEYSRKGGFDKEIAADKVKKKQNKTISNYGRKKKSDGSEEEFLDFERAAFRSLENENDVVDKPIVSRVDMEERIQKLAKCLNGADIDMPEWKFSKMMRSAQIRFSDHSILRIVQILGKLGNWRRVLQVIEWMQSRERFKSHKIRYIYTAALDALGKARRPVEALNLFGAMQEQMATYPDIVAYHSIAVTLGQAGHMKELFDVIDTMRSPPKKKFKTGFVEKWDPRLEPDVIIYNAVLNACVRRKKWEGAFWVLQQLNREGQQPSCTTYGLVMEVMLACGKYDLVHDFFKKVQKSYMPNALVYKVLVNTLWREGRTNEAVLAVEEMERRGIVGSAGLYYDLARCLCSAGRCQQALKQIDKICKVANKPLVVTYTGLIQACLDSGDVQNGAYIFNHMQKFCSPNLVTFNIMLKGFVDHGRFEEAKQLFLRLLDNGNFIAREGDYTVRVIPDIYSFNTMLDACFVEQKRDDLEFVYEQMLKYGHHFNAKRHLNLIVDARLTGKDKLLKMTWKHLVEAKRVPPPLLITEMFCTRLEKRDYAAALSCFINYASVESQLSSRKFWSKFFLQNGHRFAEGTLDELVHEARSVLAGGENLALQHLLQSCEEFLRTQRTTTELECVAK